VHQRERGRSFKKKMVKHRNERAKSIAIDRSRGEKVAHKKGSTVKMKVERKGSNIRGSVPEAPAAQAKKKGRLYKTHLTLRQNK